jgi:lipoprotein
MKKKLAIIGTIALLGVGGFTVFNLNNPDWRANTIFATAKDKQLAWLKEHEEEIVAWIHSKYPKVETIKFDWDTLKVEPISNGVLIVGYNLSVEGNFNKIPETVIWVDFFLEKSNNVPQMTNITMNQPPSIIKGNTIYNYE